MIWQGNGSYPSPNYSQRGAIYGVGGIPHSQWGGVYDIVGGGGSSMFAQYRSRYNAMVNWASPLEIELLLEPTYETLTAEITVTEEITTTNNKLILITTNHQNNDYFCSVVAYEEADFDLSAVGESQVFEYDVNPGSFDIENLTFNVLVQSMTGDYRILQAGRVIVSELSVPLQTESVEFDSTMVGESSSEMIELYNYGDDPITFMFYPPPGFAAPAEYTLEEHAIGEIEVEFVPENPGSYSDFLIVTTTHPEYPNFIIDLSGIALPGTSDSENEISNQILISENYPNPFNPQTTISFELKESANARLEIYNIKGELIEIMFDTYKSAGSYDVVWNAEKQSSGFYIAKLISSNQAVQTKMLLLK